MEIQLWQGAARRCAEVAHRCATATGMSVNEDGGEELMTKRGVTGVSARDMFGSKTKEYGAHQSTR